MLYEWSVPPVETSAVAVPEQAFFDLTEGDPEDSVLWRKFREFHAANPLVYQYMCKFARQYRAKFPTEKVGAKALYEKVRWEVWMTTSDPDFKINNNFTAYYAREMMRREKDLEGIFETRKLREKED